MKVALSMHGPGCILRPGLCMGEIINLLLHDLIVLLALNGWSVVWRFPKVLFQFKLHAFHQPHGPSYLHQDESGPAATSDVDCRHFKSTYYCLEKDAISLRMPTFEEGRYLTLGRGLCKRRTEQVARIWLSSCWKP